MLLAKLLVIPGKKQGWNKWYVLNLKGINHWIMNDKSIAHDFHKNSYTNRCQKGAGKGSAGAVGCSQKTGHMGGWVYKGGVGLPSKTVGSRKRSQIFEVNKKVQRFQQMTWFLKYTSQGFCYNHVWRRVENITKEMNIMRYERCWRVFCAIVFVSISATSRKGLAWFVWR